MNVRELKRRLMPYSGYMKPAEDGGADTGGTAVADEKPDFGNDPDPEPTEAQATADSGDAGGGDGGGESPAGDKPESDDADGQSSRRQSGIPKARFNEVNEEKKDALRKLEEANAEIERLRAAAPKPVAAPATAAKPAEQAATAEFDVDEKEQEYAEALFAGDGKKAAAIRREINANLVTEATTRAREVASSEFSARESKTLLQSAVQTTMAAYPWLNTEAGSDALELIVAARDQRIRAGVPPHLALIEAVNKIAPKFAPDDEPPSRVSDKDPAKADSRPANALARGVADSSLQPPSVQAGIGNRATAARIDVKNLTDEQLDALPAEELRRALGNA